MLKQQKNYIYRSPTKIKPLTQKVELKPINPLIKTPKVAFIKKPRKIRFFRIRKSYKFTCYPTLNPNFLNLENKNYLQKFLRCITIKIKPNNVFCTFSDNQKTLYTTSSGKCNLNTSKKTLKYTTKRIIQSFLHNIKKYITTLKKTDQYFIVNITSPKKIYIPILKQLQGQLKKKDLIVNFKSKKYFNGCRPAKKKRKKQKSLRIFK
jgi:hypothetical protein